MLSLQDMPGIAQSRTSGASQIGINSRPMFLLNWSFTATCRGKLWAVPQTLLFAYLSFIFGTGVADGTHQYTNSPLPESMW